MMIQTSDTRKMNNIELTTVLPTNVLLKIQNPPTRMFLRPNKLSNTPICFKQCLSYLERIQNCRDIG